MQLDVEGKNLEVNDPIRSYVERQLQKLDRRGHELTGVPVEPPKSGLVRAGVVDGSGVGPKEWDATVAVTAPALAGDRVQFTTIPNGDVIIGEENGDADLTPLADAVERHLGPPYRAVGRR